MVDFGRLLKSERRSGLPERLNHYSRLLSSLPEQFEKSHELLDRDMVDILTEATRYCGGDVLFSFHLASGKHLEYLSCGPEVLQHVRSGTEAGTQKRGKYEGCIGRALEEGKSYSIIGDVSDSPYFIDATGGKHTKSELIIVIPVFYGDEAVFVVNFESDKIDDFDDFDAICMLTVCQWVALVHSIEASRTLSRESLNAFADLLSRTSAFSSQDRDPTKLDRALVGLLKRALSFDALAVITHRSGYFEQRLNMDFHYGHSPRELIGKDFSEDHSSFSAEVLKKRSMLVAVPEIPYLLEKLKKYRSSTKSAIGLPMESSVEGDQCVIVLEFDDARGFSGRDKAAAESIAAFVSGFLSRREVLRSQRTMGRSIETLPRLVLLTTSSPSIKKLLENATEVLCASLRSSGCAFFEVREAVVDGSYVRQNSIHIEDRRSTEPDLRWLELVNNKWNSEVRDALSEKRLVEFPHRFRRPVAGGAATYRILVFPLRLAGKEMLFVSFKAVDERRFRTLRLSEVSRQIMETELSVLQQAVESQRRQHELRIANSGLEAALEVAFAASDRDGASYGGSLGLSRLYEDIHRFFAVWDPLKTQFTAIFRPDPQQERLVMEDDSFRLLSRTVGGEQGPERPLSLPIISEGEGGLTVDIWKRGVTRFSLEVDRDGSPNCQDYWNQVTGIPAQDRYFVGASIPRSEGSGSYGVVTLTGAPLVGFKHHTVELVWGLVPVLELVAKRIGRRMEEIERGPSLR